MTPDEIGIHTLRFENTGEYEQDLEQFFSALELELGIELEVRKELKNEATQEIRIRYR